MARRPQSLATGAEAWLWAHLRAKRLVGAKFRRQHPVGPYAVDSYCQASKLASKLDGDQHAEPQRWAFGAKRMRRLYGVLEFVREALTD